jgi:hypothetical protein
MVEHSFENISRVRRPLVLAAAWMWGALPAGTMAAWLHQLAAATRGEDILQGHGVRCGRVMIATLWRRVVSIPGCLIRHAYHLILRLPPDHGLFAEILARLRVLSCCPYHRACRPGPESPGTREPGRHLGHPHARTEETTLIQHHHPARDQLSVLLAESGQSELDGREAVSLPFSPRYLTYDLRFTGGTWFSLVKNVFTNAYCQVSMTSTSFNRRGRQHGNKVQHRMDTNYLEPYYWL